MKKILVFVILSALIISINAEDLKRYQIKSGIIEYKIEGNTEGTETLYFDNYGKIEAKRSKMKTTMMGFTQETNTLTLLKDNFIYLADYTAKTISKMENPSYEMLKEMAEKETDLEKISEDILTNMGGKKIGTETFQDKKCDVWEIASLGSKMWIHKSVPLKTEVNMMGMKITYTAVKVELDVPVPSDKFELPKGFKEQDAPNLQDFMK